MVGPWLVIHFLGNFLLSFLVEREMVMNIIALQKLYESLIYFGFISNKATFDQLTRLKYYLTFIVPLGYYQHFSEWWTTFYDSTENLTLDNTFLVSHNHTGHNFSNTFMIDVCVYNKILNNNTHHVPWKAIALYILDAIMRQITSIYDFFMAAIRKPPELCLSVIRLSGRFLSMPSDNPVIF